MKYLFYIIEYIIVKFLFLIFELVGYKKSSNIGFLIGKHFGSIFRSKTLIIKNLSHAITGTEDRLNLLASNVLGNYGRILSEYVFLKDFRSDKLKDYISIEGCEYLEQIKVEKKKVVFISGHFNNFELMAMQLEKFGIDIAAIYRPLNNKFLNKTMEKIRKQYICKKQIKKGRSGTRDLIKNFREGSSVALMIDQRVREGIRVPFFNDLSSTTTIPAQLVKKYNCEIVPIYIERNNKFFFSMKVSKPIIFNQNQSIENITIELNKILEKMILKNIDQWIWTHNRWQK